MRRAHRPLSFAAALALLASGAGCALREAPSPGVIVPPTPLGPIDASSSRWRAISSVGAPPPGDYQLFWTARGLAFFSRNGGGGFYDPYQDSWRAVAPGQVDVTERAWVSERSLLFTGVWGPAPRAFDLASATWRSVPEPPGGVHFFPAQAWTGSALFLWGGAVKRSGRQPRGSENEDTGAGAILDVASAVWRPVAREGAPSPRTSPVATWSGAAFFVWGGTSRQEGPTLACVRPDLPVGCEPQNSGALYDPVQERWSEIPAEGAPPRLIDPGILWTGSVVLLWDQTASTARTTVYAYDPRARRWLAPLVMPVAFTGRRTGVSGGRAIFLDQTGGYTLDADTKRFSPIPIPEDLRSCWSAATHEIEAARVVVVCHGGTITVSAFDPRHGTWKTARLPPVPPPRTPSGNPVSDVKEKLAWTGAQIIAWTSTYQVSGPDTSCANVPGGLGCDPVGPPVALVANEGFILQPSL